MRVLLWPVLTGRRQAGCAPFGAWWSVSAPCRDTALHLASGNGDTETAKALLKNGAAVDATNSSGKTAFHVATFPRAFIAAVEVRCVRAIAA